MSIYEITLKALNNNALIDLFEGKGNYKCELNRFIGAEIPTDWAYVMRSGVYQVYNQHKELGIDKKIEQTLLEMCDGNSFDIYCATMVFFFQILSEEERRAPFRLNRDKILNKVRTSLQKHQLDMHHYYEWTGANYEDGIWGDIVRIHNILNQDYGIKLI